MLVGVAPLPCLIAADSGAPTARWNHNIHHHPVVLGAVPPGARDALDVGCGEGILTREVRAVVPRVTGIDRDGPTLQLAREHPGARDIEYVRGDFLTHPFAPGSFDLVACVAALHHMDEAAALARMRALLRPGGSLVVVGLARRRLPADLPLEAAGAVTTRLHQLTKRCWPTPAPIRPPRLTFGEIRRLTARELPGRRYRRHVLWRYSVRWTKPTNAATSAENRAGCSQRGVWPTPG